MAKTYRTNSGDTWDIVAKEVYGSESYASFLMSNNQNLLEYFVFPEDVQLNIVDLPEEDNSTLPKWRT